jgi:hypothetical protein
VAAWKGPDTVEHGLRRVHQRLLVPPWFLQTPPRLAALGLLILVGALVAGRLERQVRRAVAARQQPSSGVRPAGRDTWRPTVARLFTAGADSRLVQVTAACGRVVERRCARLHPVPAHRLKRRGLPRPAALCAQPVLSCV